ncbi:hypothetical protein CXB51_004990 [Gossypium anomalum]|uniref:Uncharacterized protein n=1 Tax=Gossypium anomalum TaxID=47600 RepID=A0A8J5ZBI2_9ROSI|nr:hypothetical protein CXB51_004990 [Gossypium anomalum]
MVVSTLSPVSYRTRIEHTNLFPSKKPQFNPFSLAKKSLTIISMAPQKKYHLFGSQERKENFPLFLFYLLLFIHFQLNKYDPKMEKQWFGARIFYKGSEEIEVDVFKKLKKRKVLRNVEKVGLLSKMEELGFTHSLIEKLSVSLKRNSLTLVAMLAAIMIISDDSVGLVAVQVVVAGALVVGAAGLLGGSVVLGLLETLRGIFTVSSLLFFFLLPN